MLPHAVIFLYTVSYVTMGFPTMHSLVQCQGKRTNNVLLWQPNMLPARLGSRTRFLPLEWIPSTEAVFSFPLFSVSPPLSYPDFSSSAKRFQLSACWSIHPAGKLGIADNLWEFIDQSVCAAKCIYTRNNNIKCSTLSVQSLVMKPCENMERAEYSTGKSHWEIISKCIKTSVFPCWFIIPLLFKITKCHFAALNLPFWERKEAFSLMIIFTNWPHTISYVSHVFGCIHANVLYPPA